MRQVKTFSDSRLDTQCAYCGAYPENRDHVPSKIFLDKPFPDNLPVVASCIDCNSGYSMDEEYFACVIECASCGTFDIDELVREPIKKTLRRNQKLHTRIKLAFEANGGVNIETERFENVLLKCAFGHLKFENSETVFTKPDHIWHKPIHSLTEEEELIFFSISEMQKAPEVGSRAMQRLYLSEDGKPIESWINVQNGVYSYFVSISLGLKIVRIIIRNYLACEIAWTNDK
ncbi:hypothetical protein [Labilibaculum euxinus]